MENLLSGNIRIKEINFRNLPIRVQILSYLMVFVPILCIPGYAIYKLWVTPGQDLDEVNKEKFISCNKLLGSFALQRLQRSVQFEESFVEHTHRQSNSEENGQDNNINALQLTL